MSFPYTLRMQDIKIESLETQLDYLNLLRLRHLQWMSSADDLSAKEFHSKIAKSLEEITQQYNCLLSVLPR